MTTRHAAFAVSRVYEDMIPPERDTTVRSTFIRADDHADGEETTLPAFSHTLSGPAAHLRKRRNWSDIFEEEGVSDMEFEVVVGDKSEEPKRLGSSWALHSRGECVPCAYSIVKRDGCRKGSQCDRCHFCTDVELRQWKKTTRKAKNEWKKLERQAREGAMQVTKEQVAAKEDATLAGRLVEKMDSSESSEDMSRPFIVKNTFLHFSDDEEDEDLLPVRKCQSDPCLRQGEAASKLETFRTRLSDLLAASAQADGQGRGTGSSSSSCSASRSPSARGTSGWKANWSSGSTDLGEAMDEADDSSDYVQSVASQRTTTPEVPQVTGLETQGATFETHQSGKCQPCFYFSFKADGCRKGADCIYCHFCSGEESRQRKRVAKTVAKQIKRAHGVRGHSKTREG